jgi:hypothetical protein
MEMNVAQPSLKKKDARVMLLVFDIYASQQQTPLQEFEMQW